MKLIKFYFSIMFAIFGTVTGVPDVKSCIEHLTKVFNDNGVPFDTAEKCFRHAYLNLVKDDFRPEKGIRERVDIFRGNVYYGALYMEYLFGEAEFSDNYEVEKFRNNYFNWRHTGRDVDQKEYNDLFGIAKLPENTLKPNDWCHNKMYLEKKIKQKEKNKKRRELDLIITGRSYEN